jgi:sorbitol-specific phosphotransferase system component IIBC
VASHVSQASGWGALRYLYTLRGGEMIYTNDASGHTQQWQLTQMRMRMLEHTDFPQEYWSKDGVRQLVVVTCGGTIRSGHYDKNIFAIAKPVDPKGA